MADGHETTTTTTTTTATTTRARGFFYAALGLFLLWVAALVGLAIVSGYRPAAQAGALAPEQAQ